MNFEPLGDRLVVKPEPFQQSYHGLVIPEVAQRGGALGGDKFLRYGTVIAAGPGDPCKCVAAKAAEESRPDPACTLCSATGLLPMNVAVGDRILYDHPSDGEYRIDGDDVVVIHEEQHVLAVLD